MSTNGLTMRVAQWASEQTTVPDEIRHHVTRLVLDHLAGVVAGSGTPVSMAVAAHARATYGGASATGIGAGKLSAPGAAFVNGTAAHGLEVDDGYTPGSVHPSAVALPAVLATAQRLEAGPERTLAASAVALELTCRLAAAGHPATWRNHFHNTPLAGVIGAAAGVASLSDLTPDRVADALGIAGSHAGGLFEFLGNSAEVKRVHPGKAARDGVVSAELASAGVTGPRTVLEGDNGYFAAFAGDDWAPDLVGDALGARWSMLDTYVKPYPSCRHLHGPIDAALALRRRHWEADRLSVADVAAAHVGTYAVAARHADPEPGSLLDAQMSIPHAVSVALARGRVALDEFGESARTDPETRRLARAVTVEVDRAAEEVYPRARPAVLTLSLRDGRTLTETVEQPYGEPANPITDASLTEKFHSLVDPVTGAGAATALADAVWRMADLSFLDHADRLVRAV